ncbi:hypothetical protein KI387_006236, partial [Taxus chinensis]
MLRQIIRCKEIVPHNIILAKFRACPFRLEVIFGLVSLLHRIQGLLDSSTGRDRYIYLAYRSSEAIALSDRSGRVRCWYAEASRLLGSIGINMDRLPPFRKLLSSVTGILHPPSRETTTRRITSFFSVLPVRGAPSGDLILVGTLILDLSGPEVLLPRPEIYGLRPGQGPLLIGVRPPSSPRELDSPRIIGVSDNFLFLTPDINTSPDSFRLTLGDNHEEDSKGTEDAKDETLQQETWDDMIINFFAESLDVIRDPKWTSSVGNSLCRQYGLYIGDNEHSSLLHRCLGVLLQKIDNKAYVREKLDWMYKKANIADKTNRIGLAKGVGLVAATHLDTVLEKLKNILDSEARNNFQRAVFGIDVIGCSVPDCENDARFLSLFMDSGKKPDLDDIHAALALMYGYTASYAPSTVIEARIDALVGTNMLSRLLHVRKPEAKQAVITAIDLLGRAVIKAAESGASFPLKRRDQMLDYTLTLMAGDGSENLTDSDLELLHTQTLALNTCTTLVSVEPKLTFETRNHILKATLGFFTLPNNPPDVVDPLINNLITLLCVILLTSGEDGKSRADQLQHILKSIDQYVSSPIDHQRKRGCVAVYKLLIKFQALCSGGHCGFGCLGICMHARHLADVSGQRNPSAFFLPSRESLNLGERVMAYLPRCTDVNSETQKISAKILDLLFIISLSLPRPVGSTVGEDREMSYTALTALEDVISIYDRDAMIDQSDAFYRIVSSICILMTKEELVAALHGCVVAICDRVKQSAEGTVEAVTEFILKRGRELNETDVSRITQSLLSATVAITDKHLRREVLNATCCLAEHASAKIVFSEVLSAAERDVMTKDITRLRGGWPIQDAFYAFSQHDVLSMMFLDHVIAVLNQAPYYKEDIEKIDYTEQVTIPQVICEMPQAATLALSAIFRGGGKISKKVVERRYAAVFCALTLQFGSIHGLVAIGVHQPLRTLLHTFQAFCECIGDHEMGKILAKDVEQLLGSEKWTEIIGGLSKCVAGKRPKEVETICNLLWKSLNRSQRFQHEAAAAVLSEYVRS